MATGEVKSEMTWNEWRLKMLQAESLLEEAGRGICSADGSWDSWSMINNALGSLRSSVNRSDLVNWKEAVK